MFLPLSLYFYHPLTSFYSSISSLQVLMTPLIDILHNVFCCLSKSEQCFDVKRPGSMPSFLKISFTASVPILRFATASKTRLV